MRIHIASDKIILGNEAGQLAAEIIRLAIQDRQEANIILATGTSQFGILDFLKAAPGMDWSKVNMFHLDEYIGLAATHPASFRNYLQTRFLDHLPALKSVHLIDGEADPGRVCEKLGREIAAHPIDLALVGIGENGHLAFNDPPADFESRDAFLVVSLDEACRNQQLGEGWFNRFDEVPARAISMSVHQIMLAARIICSVPDRRKALAVKQCLQGPVSNLFPASILQTHPECDIWLDPESAALL